MSHPSIIDSGASSRELKRQLRRSVSVEQGMDVLPESVAWQSFSSFSDEKSPMRSQSIYRGAKESPLATLDRRRRLTDG